MAQWLTLCGDDPLLDLVQQELGSYTLLRRPAARLDPLDVLMLVHQGWRRPPRVVNLGPLAELTSPGAAWTPPEIYARPSVGFKTRRSSALTHRLSAALLKELLSALKVDAGAFDLGFKGADGLTFELDEVQERGAVAVGRLPRLLTTHAVWGSVKEGRARLFLVTATLSARHLKLRRAQDLELLYDISLGSDTVAKIDAKGQASLEVNHDGAALVFAVSGVGLAMTSDGSPALEPGGAPVMFGDVPATSTASGPPRLSPREPILHRHLAITIEPLPPQGWSADMDAPPEIKHITVAMFGSGDIFAPAFHDGTTNLFDEVGLSGVCHVTSTQDGSIEDTIVRTDDRMLRVDGQAVGEAGGQASGQETEALGASPFSGRLAFAEQALAEMNWPPEQEALYQSARFRTYEVRPAQREAFIDALVDKAGPARVLKLSGTRLYSDEPTAGYALIGDAVAAGPVDEWKREIHQLVPADLNLPPDAKLTLSEASPREEGAALRARLRALLTEEALQYAYCTCKLRRFTVGLGHGPLINPGPAEAPMLPGLV